MSRNTLIGSPVNQRANKYWPAATSWLLVATGAFLAMASFLAVFNMPDLLWHPARDAELVATYDAYQQTGTLLVKQSGTGSNYTQAPSGSEYSSAAWDDDPGIYILASLLGGLTQSASPYAGLRAAEAVLVALPLLWLPLAVARVFRRARAGYALILLPPILWLVNNGTILLGTEYGLSDSVSTLRVYALYGMGASLTLLSLSLLLLATTYRFKTSTLFLLTLGFGVLAALGNLTRSLSGVGIALAVGIIWWLNTSVKPKFIMGIIGSLAALLIAVGLTSATMVFLNEQRAIATKQNLTELPDSHGTWHPLYLGLSFPEPINGEASELGIPWSDEFGWEKAREVNPNVIIAGEEYDLIIKDAFWQAVKEQPVEALRTYIGKFLFVIKHFGAMFIFILLGIGLALARRGNRRHALLAGVLIALPSLLIGFIPPVLVMPLLYYFSDLSAALGLLLALSLGSLSWYVSTLPGSIRASERLRISQRIERTERNNPSQESITVVIPCRNGSKVIEQTVLTLSSYLSGNDEIIVVENGSTDNTWDLLDSLSKSWNHACRLETLQSAPGMGNALRTGVIASKSTQILLTADDLPFGMTDFVQFNKLDPSTVIAIGSKVHRDSIVSRTGSRELQSKVFRWLRTGFLQSEVGDSQGTIWVDGSWARTFAILSHETGLMWSTEMVLAAEQQGIEVIEVPVELAENHSQVKSRFGVIDAINALKSFVKLSLLKDEYSSESWSTEEKTNAIP